MWACCSGHHLTYATHATRDCDSVLDVKPTAAEAAWFSVSSGSGQWQAQAHLAGQVSDDVGYAARRLMMSGMQLVCQASSVVHGLHTASLQVNSSHSSTKIMICTLHNEPIQTRCRPHTSLMRGTELR